MGYSLVLVVCFIGLAACAQVSGIEPTSGNPPTVSSRDAYHECEGFAKSDMNKSFKHQLTDCMAKKGYRVDWK